MQAGPVHNNLTLTPQMNAVSILRPGIPISTFFANTFECSFCQECLYPLSRRDRPCELFNLPTRQLFPRVEGGCWMELTTHRHHDPKLITRGAIPQPIPHIFTP